ncbi:MAG: VCBS repeat-containing protein [Elusimicrobia bacterium]|nr:VCBS repeat-containing protein [Elusimicrobiota bacterium]
MTSTPLLHRATQYFFWCLLVLLIPLGGSGWALMTFQPNDGNVRLLNDVRRSTALVTGYTTLTTGDFDGDGLDDVAVCAKRYGGVRTVDLFLAPFDPDGSYSTKKTMEIRYALSGDSHTLFVNPSLDMADLDGDGKADLIVGRQDFTTGLAEVAIVFGKKNPTGVIDLDGPGADGRIIGVSQVAAGDFNGDGAADLALNKAGSAVGYIGLGGAGKFSGVINLSVSNPFHRVSLGGNLRNILSGDFNGDKKTDFAFSPPNDLFHGSWEEVDIVFGKDSLPTLPSPGGLAVDVRILGNGAGIFIGLGVGDMTGDGKADLFLFQQGGYLWAIEGKDISVGKPVLVQLPGQPNSVSFHLVTPADVQGTALVVGDFDGDGAADIFPGLQGGFTGFLTSSVHPGGVPLSGVGPPAMEWGLYLECAGAGDTNGDGFKDLVVYENFNSIYPPHGALRVLYGFRPLTNPSIRAMAENVSPRVPLALGVDGNPTEMLLSGDITDNFKETWIPFKALQEVVLSPTEGTKTVTGMFRNAVGRTSDPISTTVEIRAENSSVIIGTNRLRPGGKVAFDCHVTASGSLRAGIYNSAGKEVLEMENRWVEPGIYPLFWDGRNAFGSPVGRGVYFLVIEANGGRLKKEILVE